MLEVTELFLVYTILNYSRTLFILLVLAVPVASYLFLDQISVRRAEDFAVKWSARESPGFHDLAQLMASYEDVIFASGDLKGIGVIQDGKLLHAVGETTLEPALPATMDSAKTTRIGFLRYATTDFATTRLDLRFGLIAAQRRQRSGQHKGFAM